MSSAECDKYFEKLSLCKGENYCKSEIYVRLFPHILDTRLSIKRHLVSLPITPNASLHDDEEEEEEKEDDDDDDHVTKHDIFDDIYSNKILQNYSNNVAEVCNKIL